MIETTVWSWPADSTKLVALMQRGYAIEVWKVLFNTYQANAGYNNTWGVAVNPVASAPPSGAPGYVPPNYPTLYALWNGVVQIDGFRNFSTHWLHEGGGENWSTAINFPPASTLNAQFNPPVEGQVFPLGTPTAEVFQGQNGWPIMNVIGVIPPFQALPPEKPPHQLPALGVDLNTPSASNVKPMARSVSPPR